MHALFQSFAHSPHANRASYKQSRITLPKFPGQKLYPVLDDTVNIYNVFQPQHTEDINSYHDILQHVPAQTNSFGEWMHTYEASVPESSPMQQHEASTPELPSMQHSAAQKLVHPGSDDAFLEQDTFEARQDPNTVLTRTKKIKKKNKIESSYIIIPAVLFTCVILIILGYKIQT